MSKLGRHNEAGKFERKIKECWTLEAEIARLQGQIKDLTKLTHTLVQQLKTRGK